MSTVLTLQEKILEKQREQEKKVNEQIGQAFRQMKSEAEEQLSALHNDLMNLREELVRSFSKELNIIEKDINGRLWSMKKDVNRTWIYPMVIAVSLFLGISIGAWGLTQFLTSRIKTKLEYLEAINTKIDDQVHTLEKLKEKGWGVSFYKEGDKKFIIFPKGMTTEGYTFGKGKKKRNGVLLVEE